MNSITQDVHQKNVVSQKMQNFFATYRIGQILRKANACKITGVPAIQIVLFIFSMAFSSKSIYIIMGPLSRPLPKILRVPSDRTVLSSEAPKVELIRNLIA